MMEYNYDVDVVDNGGGDCSNVLLDELEDDSLSIIQEVLYVVHTRLSVTIASNTVVC